MNKFLALVLYFFTVVFSSNALAGLPPTSTKINGESAYSTTFKTDFGSFTGTRSGSSLTLTGIGAATGTSLALGGTLNANAVLDVQSTTKAFLPPRMTDVQMKAIASPTAGMTVYNTDYNILASYNGSTWNYLFGKLSGDDTYSAKGSSTGVITDENTDFINGNATLSTSVFTGTWTSGRFNIAPNCTASIANTTGTTTNNLSIPVSTTTTGFTINTVNNGTASAQPFVLTCQKAGADYAATSSAAVLQSSANYSRRAYTPTFTGFGTVSAVSCYESRNGEFNDIDCKFTAGTPTATEARISLPGTNVTSTSVSTLEIAGTYTRNTGDVNHGGLIYREPSTGYLTFSTPTLFGSATSQAYAKVNADAIIGTGGIVQFTARVPVSGWTNSPLIVGSFEGIEKCASVAECTDVVSAKVASGAGVSDENMDWINGNCTFGSPIASQYNCPVVAGTFTVKPNCWGSANSSRFVVYDQANSTTTNVVMGVMNVASSFVSDTPFSFSCQKTGADSKPKTAKIASPIGVPTVPGIVGVSTGDRVDTFSFSYGTTNIATQCTTSPCLLDQIGSAVSSVTRSTTGTYSINAAKTYIKWKCAGNAINPGSDTALIYGTSGVLQCANCNALAFTTSNRPAGTALDTAGTILCQGTY